MKKTLVLAIWLVLLASSAQAVDVAIRNNTSPIKTGSTYFATTETTLVEAQSDSSITHVTLVSPITLTASRTITKPLYVNGGAIITTTGYTLTLSGGFDAGEYQVFAGTGTVTGLDTALCEWWGVTGTSDNVAINKAIQASNRVLLRPGSVYVGNSSSGLTINKSNFVLEMYGATIRNMYVDIDGGSGAISNIHILGGTIEETTETMSFLVNIGETTGNSVSYVTFRDVRLRADVPRNVYHGYIRATAHHVTIADVYETDKSGWYVEGNNHTFSNVISEGSAGDDFIALKSIYGNTYDITVEGCKLTNHSAIISAGSLNGSPPIANSYKISNIVITNCITIEPSYGLFFLKSINSEYEHQQIEDISIVNCHSIGPLGNAGNYGAGYILVNNDCVFRNIRMQNCTINSRSNNDGSLDLSHIKIRCSGTSITENIQITDNIFRDTEQGLTGSNGGPWEYGVMIEVASGTPTINNIFITGNIFDGLKENGIVLPNSNGPYGITVDKNTFVDVMQSATSAYKRAIQLCGGSYALSNKVQMGGSTGKAIGPYNDSNYLFYSESRTSLWGSADATSDANRVVFVASTPSYIYRVYLISPSSITLSDTDYVTLSLYNETTSQTIATATTKQTGGIDLSAMTSVSMTAANITDQDARVSNGDVISLRKTHSGNGQSIDDMYVRVLFVEN